MNNYNNIIRRLNEYIYKKNTIKYSLTKYTYDNKNIITIVNELQNIDNKINKLMQETYEKFINEVNKFVCKIEWINNSSSQLLSSFNPVNLNIETPEKYYDEYYKKN